MVRAAAGAVGGGGAALGGGGGVGGICQGIAGITRGGHRLARRLEQVPQLERRRRQQVGQLGELLGGGRSFLGRHLIGALGQVAQLLGQALAFSDRVLAQPLFHAGQRRPHGKGVGVVELGQLRAGLSEPGDRLVEVCRLLELLGGALEDVGDLLVRGLGRFLSEVVDGLGDQLLGGLPAILLGVGGRCRDGEGEGADHRQRRQRHQPRLGE